MTQFGPTAGPNSKLIRISSSVCLGVTSSGRHGKTNCSHIRADLRWDRHHLAVAMIVPKAQLPKPRYAPTTHNISTRSMLAREGLRRRIQWKLADSLLISLIWSSIIFPPSHYHSGFPCHTIIPLHHHHEVRCTAYSRFAVRKRNRFPSQSTIHWPSRERCRRSLLVSSAKQWAEKPHKSAFGSGLEKQRKN